MKTGTKLFLFALAVTMMAAAPSQAQDRNVTFRVDMNPFINVCGLFNPQTNTVSVPGSFNDWNTGATPMTDANSDGIYEATVPIAQGTSIAYKFFATPDIIGWEDGDNREYTVTGDANQVLPVADFRRPCSANAPDYSIEFRVDMSVARLNPNTFDPNTDIVVVAGSFNGWSTTLDTLVQDFFNPNVYAKLVEVDNLPVPQTLEFKFVIGKPGQATPQGWESISNRQLALNGQEPDLDGDGRLDVVLDPAPYFNDVGPNDVFTEPTTIRFEVDLRPAFYRVADHGSLPGPDPVSAITGLFVNGPLGNAIDGLQDWAGWDPDNLGSMQTRRFRDDGQGGDLVAGDSVYTLVATIQPGIARRLVAKYSVNGFDNEAAFAVNQNYNLTQGTTVNRAVFGAVRLANGRYTDDCGPSSPGGNQPCVSGDYDPYILINNSANPPTVVAVRSGGEADGPTTSVEPVGTELPERATLSQNYPNPFNPTTTFEYAVPRGQHVTLKVYDLMGREVMTLVDAFQTPSTYRVSLDGSQLASGTYLYRLQVGSEVITRRMTLVK